MLVVTASAHSQARPALTVSSGYGLSHGGFGIYGEVHPIREIGLHAGVGYLPAYAIRAKTELDFVDGVFMTNVGVKFYQQLGLDPYYLYADLQYGQFGVEGYHDPENYWNDQQTLFGPSILVGSEARFRLSETLGAGLTVGAGVSYVMNGADWIDYSVQPALDVGFLLYVRQ